MNNYDLSKVESEKNQGVISPYLTYGSGQLLKINDIELKISQNTNAPKAILHMESKPIDDTNFTPMENAKGKVGRIGCGPYMNSEPLKREFLQKMKTIAASLGLEEKINQIRSEDFQSVVAKIASLLKGKYANYTIVAQEYAKPDGRIGITLSLPKFKFVEPEGTSPSTIVVFDKTNQYHYKGIPKQTNGSSGTFSYVTGTTPSFTETKGDFLDNYSTPLNLDNPPEEKVEEDFSDMPF